MDTLLIWVLVYFVLASQFYILDKEGKFFLRKLYLFFYNLGHRQEISEAEVSQGFVFNQTIGKRLTAAVIFDLILSVIFWKFNSLDTGIKILLLFIGTPTVFLGFWFGGVLMSLISKMFKRTVKTIDDIETGKIDPMAEIQRPFGEIKETVEDSLQESSGPTPEPDAQKKVQTDTDTELRSKEDEDALAALRAFQKGK